MYRVYTFSQVLLKFNFPFLFPFIYVVVNLLPCNYMH